MRSWRWLLACGLAACALPACGGDGGDDAPEAVIYTVDEAAACLRRAGVTRVNTNAGEDLDERGLAAKGALEGTHGKTNFAVVFEADEDDAFSTENRYAGVAGGSWQRGVPIGELLKRAENAVLVYEDRPTPAARKAIEGCFGGAPRIDPEVEREFGR